MKIQRYNGSRSIGILWEFDSGLACFIVFFLILLLSNHAVAQNGLAPNQAMPQFGPTINKNMAVVLMVLLCFFFVLGFFSVCTRRCSQDRSQIGDYDFAVLPERNNSTSSRTARGLDAKVLETFPTFVYSTVKKLKIGKSSLECAVCLNAFEDDDLLRFLPKCGHVFHSDCIDAWLASQSTCPVCRANLLPKLGEVNLASFPFSESNRGAESNQLERQVSIRIAEERHSRNAQALIADLSRTTPRSRSTGWRIGGIFERNNSTGHSIVCLVESDERFTLRFPDDVRSQILNSAVGRSRSCLTLPRERSQREGYREELEVVEIGKVLSPGNSGRVGRRSYTPNKGGQV